MRARVDAQASVETVTRNDGDDGRVQDQGVTPNKSLAALRRGGGGGADAMRNFWSSETASVDLRAAQKWPRLSSGERLATKRRGPATVDMYTCVGELRHRTSGRGEVEVLRIEQRSRADFEFTAAEALSRLAQTGAQASISAVSTGQAGTPGQ